MNGHPAGHAPGGRGQSPPETDPLRPLHIADQTSAAELVDRMAGTAFQARNLGQAARIWDAMLRDNTTIFFGLAGAMVPAGMRPVIVYLIENHLVDVIVSTGANLFHDVYEALGFAHAQGDPEGDDVRLAHLRVVRFFDALAPEHEFNLSERFCTEFSLTLDPGRTYTTREYFHLFGKALAPVAKEEGILTAAAKHGVPVYCPAIGDSVHGLALAAGRLTTGHRVIFDMIGDVLEMIHLSMTAEPSGVIYIGGGTPKNYIQQCGVATYVYEHQGQGHKYGIQITMDSPQWGGLSGCTFEEAVSWRKIAPDARFVTANVEATIGLPLIVSALAEGSKDAIASRQRPPLDWEWQKHRLSAAANRPLESQA